jgi:hypothetical protein
METEIKGQIVIRAYDTKRALPVKIRPMQDRTGKLYTGQGKQGYFESLSHEDKMKMGYIITPDTTIVLQDGKVFDNDDPIDKENLKWILKHPYIAVDFAKGKSSRDAIFYVQDKKKEAETRVTASKTKDKARFIIQFQLSPKELVYVAKALGNLSAEAFTELEIQDWLLNLAELAPEAVLFHADKKNSDETDGQILFNELERWRIIVKHRGGVFRFGGEDGLFLGQNAEQVVAFLRKPENADTVAAIKMDLEAKKTSA